MIVLNSAAFIFPLNPNFTNKLCKIVNVEYIFILGDHCHNVQKKKLKKKTQKETEYHKYKKLFPFIVLLSSW